MHTKRAHLYLIAALIWGIAGAILSTKGFMAYCQLLHTELWWLVAITIAVIVMFYSIFRRVVSKYCVRIAALHQRVRLWHTFPLQGWLLIAFMTALGATLKNIPTIPLQFTASFYSGLGPMLLWSAVKFCKTGLYHKE